MEKYIYLIVGLILGGIIIFLWLKQKYSAQNATLAAQASQAKEALEAMKNDLVSTEEEVNSLENSLKALNSENATLQADKNALDKQVKKAEDDYAELEKKIETLQAENKKITSELATANAENKALEDKLNSQKEEIKELHETFQLKFKNIASEILKENTVSFSEQNEKKIKTLLDPLNKDIKEFKSKVEEVYVNESKERFSLGEKVKELAEKSEKISQDAINLTNALKGESKTQGRWGEITLERILEASGLRKGETYFMEAQLYGPDGTPLRSEVKGKKMRPDALIKYPDERNVIVDSKVSLTAFVEYSNAETPEAQKQALEEHLKSVKTHIIGLSSKGYEDYDKSLDFVMMFIPNEPAYIAAMQADPELWNFAYEKRILLMNPTNLITALKLIVDLWKREYQNLNAKEIASRGEKLYKKFVGFVQNMEGLGDYLDKAKGKYDEAYKQLSTGNDNLVLQATKLKKLGDFQPKKDLNQQLIEQALKDEEKN